MHLDTHRFILQMSLQVKNVIMKFRATEYVVNIMERR